MPRIIARILIILLAAGAVSGGAYLLVQTTAGSFAQPPQFQRDPAQNSATAQGSATNGTTQQNVPAREFGGERGPRSLGRGGGALFGALEVLGQGLVWALVIAVIYGGQRIIGRLRRRKPFRPGLR